jgi:hypothetical protein
LPDNDHGLDTTVVEDVDGLLMPPASSLPCGVTSPHHTAITIKNQKQIQPSKIPSTMPPPPRDNTTCRRYNPLRADSVFAHAFSEAQAQHDQQEEVDVTS